MTYLSGKTRKRKIYIYYAVYTVVFVVIVSFWSPIRRNLYPVVEPVVSVYGTIRQSFLFFPEFFHTYSTSHKELVAREKELELKVASLENTLAEKDARLREYNIASSSLRKDEKSLLLAYPLMQDVTKLYSTVLLSKGFEDGVSIGDTVTLEGDQIVCTIREVYKSSSQCLLITSSSVTTEGVTSSSSIMISLVGRGGYFLADVERDTPITVGELVYVRSNPAFTIGTIRQIIKNDQDTSWHLIVEGAYNPITSSRFYVHQ